MNNLYSPWPHRSSTQTDSCRTFDRPPCWCISVCCRTLRCYFCTRLTMQMQGNFEKTINLFIEMIFCPSIQITMSVMTRIAMSVS